MEKNQTKKQFPGLPHLFIALKCSEFKSFAFWTGIFGNTVETRILSFLESSTFQCTKEGRAAYFKRFLNTFFLETALFSLFFVHCGRARLTCWWVQEEWSLEIFVERKEGFWVSHRATIPLYDLLTLLSLEPCSFIVLQEVHCLY